MRTCSRKGQLLCIPIIHRCAQRWRLRTCFNGWYGSCPFFRVQVRRAYKLVMANLLDDALSRSPDSDTRTALSLQVTDEDEDRLAICVSLNFTRFTPETCLFKNRRGLREWSGLRRYYRLSARSQWYCTESSVTHQVWSYSAIPFKRWLIYVQQNRSIWCSSYGDR